MKKRGQSAQTTFYLFSFVMIAVILFVGLKLTKGTQANVDVAQFNTFEKNLQQDINSIANTFGAKRVITRKLPLDYDEVCFVDIEQVNPNLLIEKPLMKTNVENKVGNNVFLFNDDIMNTLTIEGFTISQPYFFCSKNKFVGVLATGTGTKAVLQAQPNEEYCKIAQRDELCSALDFIGEEYQDNCCVSYHLCCEGAP